MHGRCKSKRRVTSTCKLQMHEIRALVSCRVFPTWGVNETVKGAVKGDTNLHKVILTFCLNVCNFRGQNQIKKQEPFLKRIIAAYVELSSCWMDSYSSGPKDWVDGPDTYFPAPQPASFAKARGPQGAAFVASLREERSLARRRKRQADDCSLPPATLPSHPDLGPDPPKSPTRTCTCCWSRRNGTLANLCWLSACPSSWPEGHSCSGGTRGLSFLRKRKWGFGGERALWRRWRWPNPRLRRRKRRIGAGFSGDLWQDSGICGGWLVLVDLWPHLKKCHYIDWKFGMSA